MNTMDKKVFTLSANIENGIAEGSKYIVTPNTQKVLQEIVDGYQIGIHSFSIIGTYGTGKSSFLLQLESDLKASKNRLLLNNPKVLYDGKFEILLVRAPQNLAEISECIQAVQSQKYNCAMITFRSAQQVRVFADPGMPWTLDGEKEDGHAEVLVQNQHLAIRLMQRKEQP